MKRQRVKIASLVMAIVLSVSLMTGSVFATNNNVAQSKSTKPVTTQAVDTTKKAPVEKVQDKKAPVKKVQDKKAPVKKVQDKKAPVKKAQDKKAPVKKAQDKKAPVKKAQDKKAPVQ